MLSLIVSKIEAVYQEEMGRLGDLADEFSAPFHPDPLIQAVYFQQFGSFLLEGLRQKLVGSLGRDIALLVLQNQKVGIHDS